MSILADIFSATILFMIPLLLVALGGMFSERSGGQHRARVAS
ncbi:MAG: hypothetical protein R2881_06225 [Eubacteriales bacterium]